MVTKTDFKTCRTHPGNPLELFCNEETCMKSICKNCVIQHPKHHIILNEAPSEPTEYKTFQETIDTTKDRFLGDLVWSNGSKVFKHDDKEHVYITEATTTRLPGYFKVKIKINRLKELGGTLIGISKMKLGRVMKYRLCANNDNQYAFCSFKGGRLFSHCDEWVNYGCQYNEGDIVTITMDKTRTLSFAVNDKDCGPGIKNLRGFFYLAITTNNPGNEFEILSIESL